MMNGAVFQSFKFNQVYYNGEFNLRGCGGRLDPNFKQAYKYRPDILGAGVSRRNAHACAAASSPAPGASYSEELLDAKAKERRKKKIAGIDQDELLDPKQLADQDSCFCEFSGLHIHHKVYDPDSESDNLMQSQISSHHTQQAKKIGLPMILLHGFGASTFSWSRVMKPLANAIGSKVLAFDRPAFGLTSRVSPFQHSSPGSGDSKPLNPYSMAFSVLATLYFIDFLATEKAILVGHSAGSLVAVNSYFKAPERVAALILIAPAIVAPRVAPNTVEGNAGGRNDQIKKDKFGSINLLKPFIKIYEVLSLFTKYVIDAIIRLVKGLGVMLNSLYRKALSAILRSALVVMLVRMIIDKFGIAAVKNAWYDSKQVPGHILDGYTKPLRVKGWDRALVEFTAATLTEDDSEPRPPLTKRLHEISCPVLIITGDTDRIVPAWNAERLARAIPGSTLEVIKNCGHLPHEEKVEEFVSIVERFLQKAFGFPDEKKSIQAEAVA